MPTKNRLEDLFQKSIKDLAKTAHGEDVFATIAAQTINLGLADQTGEAFKEFFDLRFPEYAGKIPAKFCYGLAANALLEIGAVEEA